MYKIIGVDGKEYGPVDIDQVRKWIAEGRINPQTRMQAPGAAEWKTAAEFPELGLGPAATTGGPASAPPPLPGRQLEGQQKGLAITSFVLGLLSLLCFGFLAGIPAIICGHLARGRAQREPARHGGAAFALSGLIMGYLSLVMTFVLAGLLLPALGKAQMKAKKISCVNNMKQVGLAFRVWAIDNEDKFPFNVSTNKGGTLELCRPGKEGFDLNSVFHFQVMSNELSTPKILVCPDDTGKQAALNFDGLLPVNVTYQVFSGTNVTDTNPQLVLAVCPIHNNVLLCDGSVQTVTKARREAMQKANANP